MKLDDFKLSKSMGVKVWINNIFAIIQTKENCNEYNLVSSSFFSGIDWDIAFRFKGTLNQIKHYIKNYPYLKN